MAKSEKLSIPGVQHVLAISSGKGGVGKSLVASNLAAALARSGRRVGLLDLDLMGPNQANMWSITEAPKLFRDEEHGEIFLPPESRGVKVLSMGMLVNPDQALLWRGPMLHQTVVQFCTKTDWGDLEYLVIDLPPGTGDIQLSLAAAIVIHEVIIITTPQDVAVQDVRRAIQFWRKQSIPISGIIENMSEFIAPDTGKRYSIFGEGGAERLAHEFALEVLAKIPLEIESRVAADRGTPISFQEQNTSETRLAFLALAQKIQQTSASSSQVTFNESMHVAP